MLIHIDFETFSRADLKRVGAYRYAEDPSTEVLCMAYAFDGRVEIWHPLLPPPAKLLRELQRDDCFLAGWNSGSFERRIWNIICVRDFGWPALPATKFYDVMSDALACGFPAKLEDAAKALDCPERKDPRGTALLRKLSRPVKPTKAHPRDRWTIEEAPEDFRALYDYCRQDVRTEQAIMKLLPEHPTLAGRERAIWLHTQDVNDRGLPIDLTSVKLIHAHVLTVQERLAREITELTKGEITSATQRERIRLAVCVEGYPLDDMQGTTLDRVLTDPDLPARSRKLLEIFRDSNHTSVAKYPALLDQICKDGTIKDNLVYHKATTGRYAGAGFQMQNLPRDKEDNPEQVLEAIDLFPLETVELIYGHFLELAKKLIRSMIKAKPGYVITDDDLSQIEAIITSWVADEKEILESFRQGLDIYKTVATLMYHIAYELVNKLQRQSGKIAVLAGGFGGGHGALQGMAEKYQISMTEDEAKQIIADFRQGRPRLVRAWKEFGLAAKDAVRNPGKRVLVQSNTRLSFEMRGLHLCMILPSGRQLWFPFAKIESRKAPWGDMVDVVTAMWVDNYTKKWSRRAIIGSNFFQSAVQGLARDVILDAQLRLDPVFPIIGSVHDECFSQHPIGPERTVALFQKIFSQVPAWCPGLPISSAPWQGPRYKKD